MILDPIPKWPFFRENLWPIWPSLNQHDCYWANMTVIDAQNDPGNLPKLINSNHLTLISIRLKNGHFLEKPLFSRNDSRLKNSKPVIRIKIVGPSWTNIQDSPMSYYKWPWPKLDVIFTSSQKLNYLQCVSYPHPNLKVLSIQFHPFWPSSFISSDQLLTIDRPTFCASTIIRIVELTA